MPSVSRRIPILADRIAGYRQAVRSGAMLPDVRLRYGLLMFGLGVALLVGTFAASWLPPASLRHMQESHIPFEAIFFGGIALFYAGAYVVSLALDPRSVARRSHTHHKQVT